MSTTDQNTNNAGAEVPTKKRFILYRTVASGWQPVGWVLLEQYLSSAAEGIKSPGCAWAEDDEGKYHYRDIYPVDAQKENAGAS